MSCFFFLGYDLLLYTINYTIIQIISYTLHLKIHFQFNKIQRFIFDIEYPK